MSHEIGCSVPFQRSLISETVTRSRPKLELAEGQHKDKGSVRSGGEEANAMLPTLKATPKDVCSVSHLVSVDMTPTAGSCTHSLPCSSATFSSPSSDSLEQRVVSEAREGSLIARVQALQHDAMSLSERIRGGKVDVAQVQSTLDKMLREHSHLVVAVSEVTASLEVVNQQSSGRAAKHIASSHTSLQSELCVLAQHLSSLEELLRNDSGHLTTSPIPSLQNLEDIDRGSPRLPDIYLTPSHTIHSTVSSTSSSSQQSSDSDSRSLSRSFPASPSTHLPSLSPPESYSPPSSLSHLDPFTPDTNSAPPTQNHSGVPQEDSGVLHGDSGVPPLPSGDSGEKAWTHKSETITRETLSDATPGEGAGWSRGRVCADSGGVNSVRNPAVVQWLLTSGNMCGYVHTGSNDSTTACGKTSWREETPDSPPHLPSPGGMDDCDGVATTPPGGERTLSPTVLSRSPLSPPISSPCADSGISCSNYSTSHLPPTAYHSSQTHSSLPHSSQTHSSLPRSSQTHSSRPHSSRTHSSISASSHNHTTQPSSTPTITMSEIEGLRSELARLREEIMNHSNWSHSLSQDRGNLKLGPESRPSQASVPCRANSASISTTPSVPIPNHTHTPLQTPIPPVSRPYWSAVSRPFCHASGTPTGHQYHSRADSHSSSRRLFSTPRDSMPRYCQTSLRNAYQPKLVNRMIQTTPIFDPTPDTHSASNAWNNIENRTGLFTSHPYSPSRPTFPHAHPLSLPPHFTPHLVVHCTHHHPSEAWSFDKSYLSRSGEH